MCCHGEDKIKVDGFFDWMETIKGKGITVGEAVEMYLEMYKGKESETMER